MNWKPRLTHIYTIRELSNLNHDLDANSRFQTVFVAALLVVLSCNPSSSSSNLSLIDFILLTPPIFGFVCGNRAAAQEKTRDTHYSSIQRSGT
jgi:hypothetical protein